jgi:hypothetical protein
LLDNTVFLRPPAFFILFVDIFHTFPATVGSVELLVMLDYDDRRDRRKRRGTRTIGERALPASLVDALPHPQITCLSGHQLDVLCPSPSRFQRVEVGNDRLDRLRQILHLFQLGRAEPMGTIYVKEFQDCKMGGGLRKDIDSPFLTLTVNLSPFGRCSILH